MPPVAGVYRLLNPIGLQRGHEPHYHPDTVEICFIVHGRLDCWVGNSLIEAHAGDVVVMPMGMPHGSVDSALQPCELYAVHLAPEALPASVASALSSAAMGGLHARQPEVGKLVLQIFTEHEQPDICSAETCKALCSLVVLSLSRVRASESNRGPSEFVRRAQTFLLASADSPVAEAAKSLGVSVPWLNRRFKAEVGESPGEWLRCHRIEEAKHLIAFDGLGMAEVAERLGFKSSQYFATAFKRETGNSPSDYRGKAWQTFGKNRLSRPARAFIGEPS